MRSSIEKQRAGSKGTSSKITVSCRLPRDLASKIKARAEQRGMCVSELVQTFIASSAADRAKTSCLTNTENRSYSCGPCTDEISTGANCETGDTTSTTFWRSKSRPIQSVPKPLSKEVDSCGVNEIPKSIHDYESIMRACAEYVATSRPEVLCPYDAALILRPLIMAATCNVQESFFALYLDNSNHLLGSPVEIYRGLANRCPVHPRDILRNAIMRNASSLIVAHNHPSAQSYPSNEDVSLSRLLLKACSAVGIRLLDHVIIFPKGSMNEGYTSLKQSKLVKFD